MEYVFHAIELIFQFETLMTIAFGVLIGTIAGVIPGITGSIAMAILLPFTWSLEIHNAILLLLAIYCGGQYGGSIPAILIGTPGTDSAAVTVIDGYPLNNKGQAGIALIVALLASTIGGLCSAIILMILTGPLASIALSFGPPEYFALAIFGLAIIGSLSGRNVLKGLISGLFGLFLGTIGFDTFTGQPRFTFGSMYLLDGLPLPVLMMGMFAAGQVLTELAKTDKQQLDSFQGKEKIPIRFLTRSEFVTIIPALLIGIIIGTAIGIMPGAGAAIACWVAYSEARRWSKNKKMFGKGTIEGVAAPEAANNACTGGALVPLLALGIPGSSSTAILVGAYMMHGISPGPLLFRDAPALVYIIYIGLIVANIFMLLTGFGVIKVAIKITNIPKSILYPCIIVLLFVGSFAVREQIIDIAMMLVFGIIGFLMRRFGFAPPATVLGVLLGFITEASMRRSLIISGGSFIVFFSRPISMILIILAIGTFCFSIYRELRTT